MRKQIRKLKDNHTWRAPEGYSIFVADRGAVRFNIPRDWLPVPGSKSVALHDRPPPDDNCRLEVSYLRLPPVDFSGLPIEGLLEHVVQIERRDVLSRGDILRVPRQDLDVSWTEIRFMDKNERREAFSRIALARGFGLQALITFDFWVDDASRLGPVWDEVMRSVELGRYVKDPTRGDDLV